MKHPFEGVVHQHKKYFNGRARFTIMYLRLSPSNFSLLTLVAFVLVSGLTLTACDTSDPIEPFAIPDPRAVPDSLYIATGTGLKFYDFTVGPGVQAGEGLAVEYQFITWLQSDSTVISSSFFGGFPRVAVLGSGQILPGIEEGLSTMRTGGDRQLIVPPELAYGSSGSTGVPPDATLIVELALLRVGVDNAQ